MNIEELILTPLTLEYLDQATQLCGKCVGENLYTKSIIEATIKQQNQQFFLLITPQKKAVAYIYFKLINLREAELLSKKSLSKLKQIVKKDDLIIGNLQSIGVLAEYRKCKLSEYLMKVYLEYLLKNTQADIAFGVFWKKNGEIPMEKNLKKFGFCYLVNSKRVWYDKKELICPICNGRCKCDGAIYYKILERGELL